MHLLFSIFRGKLCLEPSVYDPVSVCIRKSVIFHVVPSPISSPYRPAESRRAREPHLGERIVWRWVAVSESRYDPISRLNIVYVNTVLTMANDIFVFKLKHMQK